MTSRQEAAFDKTLAVAAVVLTLTWLAAFRYLLYHTNVDISAYYLPWYEHILAHGRWASLEGSYANYSPPYLYILSLFSLLDGKVNPIVLIKLAQVPGLIAGAAFFWSICRKLGCSPKRSLLGTWLLFVAPEVFVDTIFWGQCDMLHTACLLLMLRLLLARRPGWAMAALGVALAFKLQAIFAGAAILALFLSAEIPWYSIWAVPAGYLAMMIPAALAGRPWKQLVLIYMQQFDSQPSIAMNVANPYQILAYELQFHGRFSALVVPAGLVFATICTLSLALYLAQSRRLLEGKNLVTAFAFALILEPYLLPKMHDRYFFAGDVMVLLLAMVVPKMAIPAALLQLGNVITFIPFLYYPLFNVSKNFWILPVLLVTIALYLVGRYTFTKLRSEQP